MTGRPDLTDADRAKCNVELENAKRQLASVVKLLLAAHQNGGGGGGTTGNAGATVEMMRAQAAALQKRNDTVATNNFLNSPQYRTASPQQQQLLLQQYGQSMAPSPVSSAGQMRQSPSLAASTLPNPSANAVLEGSPPPSKKSKKLTKKQQAVVDAATSATAVLPSGSNGLQGQAAGQAQPQSQAHALALAQAQAQLQLQQQQAAASGSQSATAGAYGASLGTMSSTSLVPIVPSIVMSPQQPESFPAPRPTLSLGLANSPVVSSPAITRHPGLAAGAIQDAMRGTNGAKKEEGVGKDMREDSKGRTVSKRKIRELVESVDPEERLSDDVEDVSHLSHELCPTGPGTDAAA